MKEKTLSEKRLTDLDEDANAYYSEYWVKQFIKEVLDKIDKGFVMESPTGYKLKAVEEIKEIIKQKSGFEDLE